MIIWGFQSFRLTYFSLRWTGAVWWNEPVYLGELVRTYIIQSSTYRGVYYFIKPSEGTVWKQNNFSHIIEPSVLMAKKYKNFLHQENSCFKAFCKLAVLKVPNIPREIPAWQFFSKRTLKFTVKKTLPKMWT